MGIHPDTPVYGTDSDFRSSNSIAWNENTYELVSSGYQNNLAYLGNSRFDAPWVLLRNTKTRELVYFKNVHDPADVSGPQQIDRTKNAKSYVADIGKIASGNLIEYYVLMGDFNSSENAVKSGYSEAERNDKLPYCILTRDAYQNTFDAVKGITNEGPCPTKKDSNFSIDHIYTSNNFSVDKWVRVDTPEIHQISDHPLTFADIYPKTE